MVTKTDANTAASAPSQLESASASSFASSLVSSSLGDETIKAANEESLNQMDSLPHTAKDSVELTEAAERHDDSSDTSTDVHPEEDTILVTGEMRTVQEPPGDSAMTAHGELSGSPQAQLRSISANVSERNLQDSPPLSKAVAELKATGKHKLGKPSPLVTTPPSLSRTSSADTPQSPFTIPRNPFLSLVGKMPKFQWSSGHIRLLEDLLRSLQKIMNKWKR